MSESKSRGIVVLGMHRSGTSMLAGTLRQAGLHFGNVLDRGFKLNPKGLQEAPAILYMQEDLLKKNGGSWHEPPATVEWQALHKAVRDLFLESRADQPLWGFKDPRTLLTLEGWLDAKPDLDCVGIFRNPAETALSIHRRNEFELGKCFTIWEHYNRRLLMLKQRLDFPVIEFASDSARLSRSLAALVRGLGLNLEGEMDFFDKGLKNLNDPYVDVPKSARRLYDKLKEMV
jgi:hypothetical protein